jgi:hypothetical protein
MLGVGVGDSDGESEGEGDGVAVAVGVGEGVGVAVDGGGVSVGASTEGSSGGDVWVSVGVTGKDTATGGPVAVGREGFSSTISGPPGGANIEQAASHSSQKIEPLTRDRFGNLILSP